MVQQHDEGGGQCPHLEQVHVQYCGASPVIKLVPFNESQTSPCAGGGYKYCDSYLTRARPHGAGQPPPGLLYTSNHLWLEVGELGLCHIGVDGFLAELAGTVDAVTFATACGTHRPAVSLSVKEVEWPLLFPNSLLISAVNSRLRSDPARLTRDPYGSGWLFEGWEIPGKTRAGLIGGEQAETWQAQERERLSRAIHAGQVLWADGGEPVRGAARFLPHADVVRLFQQFFSNAGWMPEE
jgi:glycine cleavage system H protein